MDESSNSLMGMHGYCTQELVNLILTGADRTRSAEGLKELFSQAWFPSMLPTMQGHAWASDMGGPKAVPASHPLLTPLAPLHAGRASSNVFDGDKALDGAKLGGISSPCRLGLLTLFEWYKYVEVGSYLKSPALPIWVVCSESHFTVLFSANTRPLRAQPPFELLYYDELANQEVCAGVGRASLHTQEVRRGSR